MAVKTHSALLREGRNLLRPLGFCLAGKLEERGGQMAIAARVLLKIVLVVFLCRVEVDERELFHGERVPWGASPFFTNAF